MPGIESKIPAAICPGFSYLCNLPNRNIPLRDQFRMKVKEENKEKFVYAMIDLVRSIKNETENCGKLCGGVNERELTIIVFLGQNKNVRMSDIANNVDAPMSTLTNVMDKLVEKKLINRDHSGEDRRVINVSLTQAGKDAYRNVLNQKKKVAERMLSQLSDKDQTKAINYLTDLASVIRTR
jgi:DNA-binding MarR family transcriptional regulator